MFTEYFFQAQFIIKNSLLSSLRDETYLNSQGKELKSTFKALVEKVYDLLIDVARFIMSHIWDH